MTIKNNKQLIEVLEGEHIDVNKMNDQELTESFSFLNDQMLVLYNFVLAYGEYMNTRHNYTDNEQLTTLEAHLLTDICDYPQSTVTSLATSWNRSVSATSQTIRKLIEKGLVVRENSEKDKKVFYLIPTKEGIEISDNHKRYDILDIIKTIKILRRDFSLEEIQNMFDVIEKLHHMVITKER